MAKDRPPITEKVKFWEEQDKINKALIPRFFEMHEIVKELKNRESELIEKHIAFGEQVFDLEKKVSSLVEHSNEIPDKRPLILSIVAMVIAAISLLISFF